METPLLNFLNSLSGLDQFTALNLLELLGIFFRELLERFLPFA